MRLRPIVVPSRWAPRDGNQGLCSYLILFYFSLKLLAIDAEGGGSAGNVSAAVGEGRGYGFFLEGREGFFEPR